MKKTGSRMIFTILSLISVILGSENAYAQAQVVGTAGSYFGHTVYVLEAPNSRSGDKDYMLGALPNTGHGPFPIIIFVNPYSLFHAPPSTNQADILLNNYMGNGPSITIPDIFVPEQNRNFSCFSPDELCQSVVLARGNISDLGAAGGVSEKNRSQSNVDWALRNGYAVAVFYARHYAGRDAASLMIGLKNMISTLKNIPGIIDPNRIGITGGSQGGALSILPLASWSFDPRELNIAASVALVPGVDARRWVEYYYGLEQVQPREIWEKSMNFMFPMLNRWSPVFGLDITKWKEVSYRDVANRFNTPVMLIGGTDDAMCPIVEVTSFHEELRRTGKVSYSWVFRNGPPPLSSQSVPQIGHGRLDFGHATQTHILTRYMFMRHMPPNQRVVMQHPSEIDLLGMIYEMALQYLDPSATEVEKENLLHLAFDLAGNPRIWYNSSDPRIPSGPGPQAIQAAANYVISRYFSN